MFDAGYISRDRLLNVLCKVKVMVYFIFIVMTLASCSQSDLVDNDAGDKVNEQHNELLKGNEDKIEVSMEEVVYIGMKEATEYYDNLQLTSVYSYDNDDDRRIEAGEDGKREWWYVNFANKNNNFVSILVVDGKVANIECFEENGENRLIDIDDVQMTAEEAVQKAREIGLTGGDPNNVSHWVSGYNFKMSYASLTSTPNDYKIFLEVIGISPNGNFAHVDFDATTGELLLAQEEIKFSDGSVVWKDF